VEFLLFENKTAFVLFAFNTSFESKSQDCTMSKASLQVLKGLVKGFSTTVNNCVISIKMKQSIMDI